MDVLVATLITLNNTHHLDLATYGNRPYSPEHEFNRTCMAVDSLILQVSLFQFETEASYKIAEARMKKYYQSELWENINNYLKVYDKAGILEKICDEVNPEVDRWNNKQERGLKTLLKVLDEATPMFESFKRVCHRAISAREDARLHCVIDENANKTACLEGISSIKEIMKDAKRLLPELREKARLIFEDQPRKLLLGDNVYYDRKFDFLESDVPEYQRLIQQCESRRADVGLETTSVGGFLSSLWQSLKNLSTTKTISVGGVS